MNENRQTPVFTLVNNGPIKVSGNFILKSSDDKLIETNGNIFLCRCGNSSRQPFCDGSHKESCS